MANSKKNFPINSIHLDGDPEILIFFFYQIKLVSQINKYYDQITVAVLKFKRKLSGPVLKFLTQNTDFLKSVDTFMWTLLIIKKNHPLVKLLRLWS